MSNWRDDKIRELPSVRADTKIVTQIQGTTRDSVVCDQIMNRQRGCGVICVMSCLSHALPRGHPLPQPNMYIHVSENASETDNLLLCDKRATVRS